MKSLVLMLTFLTRIPIPLKFEFKQEDFSKGLLWMPFIGLLVGIPLYLFSELFLLTNDYLKAFFILVIYLMLTGGLHLDGLADYTDGVYSGRKKQRILEIMSDSSIGTFGVIALCLYFIGMMIGLSELDGLAVLFMPMVGRTAGLCMCAFGKYPKDEGMGKALIDYGKWYHGLLVLIGLVALTGLQGLTYMIGLGIVLIVMMGFFMKANKSIGGITGDVIGAAIETSQVVWLLSLVMLGGVI